MENSSTDTEEFVKVLKDVCLVRDLDIIGVAEELGVTSTTILRWLRKTNLPDDPIRATVYLQCARILGH